MLNYLSFPEDCTLKSLKYAINNCREGMSPVFQKIGFILGILSFITTGCTLMKSKMDIDRTTEATVIVGRVDAKFLKHGKPIIVAARSMGKEKKIAHYTVLHDSGEYELLVDKGEYYIFAYLDKNSNLEYDPGEPAGQHDYPKIVRALAGGVVHDIDIVIPEKGRKIEIPYGFTISSVKPKKLYSRQAGAIVSLDDELFSEENGVEGFWAPASFFKKFSGNIYFLEKYDPKKIPILFIHGASGTPKGWKYFVDHIDRTRYQPWFFYYPTGGRIDSMSYLLFWKLINLQSKYKFNKLYITAHSMGGLVARAFIVNYGQMFPYVRLFVSLSTPWGGDKMAEYGVHQSPVVVPSWRDMQPDGDFIKSLYRMKMPKYVNFYLFYGYKGNRNPFQHNNDGTIRLTSILDLRPQSEAKMNYAFHEDHASIAYSEEVLKQYNAILNEYDGKTSTARHQSKGYLRIHFTYTYDFKGVRPRPLLILTPKGKKGAEISTFLNKDDNGRILGPFPVGKYNASLVTTATAGIPDKKLVPISIEENKTDELDFVFAPDGLVGGCVTSNQESEFTPGMPEYVYRSGKRKIIIESISLKGNGIYRSPQPVRGKYYNDIEYLISKSDFCYNECFAFRRLPAGDYSLSIKAKGYKPVKEHVSVSPGIPNGLQNIKLTSE
jgi:pimeloyl-ACP methyl ester carboxylesterase